MSTAVLSLGLLALGARAAASLCGGEAGELAESVALSSPLTSAACLREGVFLLRRGISPWSSGACAMSPLLLAGPGALPVHVATRALLAADLCVGGLLLSLAAPARGGGGGGGGGGRAASSPRRATVALRAVLASAAYLLAPPVVAAWRAAACAPYALAAQLGALRLAACGRGAPAAAALALAAALSPDSLWLLPSLVSLVVTAAAAATPAAAAAPSTAAASVASGDSPAVAATAAASSAATAEAIGVLCTSAACACALLSASLLACAPLDSPWGFFGGTVGFWADAGPTHGGVNLGLWWYLLTEVFGPLRAPFVAALHLLPRLCLPTLAFRLHGRTARVAGSDARVPSCLCASISLLTIGATRAHPTLPETVLALSLVLSQLDASLLPRTRLLPHALTLLTLGGLASWPSLQGWLAHRALNANFLYQATLLLGAGQLLLVHDVAAAATSAGLPRPEVEAGPAGPPLASPSPSPSPAPSPSPSPSPSQHHVPHPPPGPRPPTSPRRRFSSPSSTASAAAAAAGPSSSRSTHARKRSSAGAPGGASARASGGSASPAGRSWHASGRAL